MKKLEVLGVGCPKCHQVADNAQAAVQALALEVELVKVTQLADIAKFGVMSTPALAIDGQVKVAGRVPTVEEIKAWLSE